MRLLNSARAVLRPIFILLALLVLVSLFLVTAAARAQSGGVDVTTVGLEKPRPAHPGQAPDRLLVRFRPGLDSEMMGAIHRSAGASQVHRFQNLSGLTLVQLPSGVTLAGAMRRYRAQREVLYAQPDFVYTAMDVAPNDPQFGQLWGMTMIHAPAAWSVTTGASSVVIGVIDTGIDYTHPDLVANVWRNVADCNGNGIDDDHNGYVDDCYGIDTINHDSDPRDDYFHGTHVAGTIGAAGNNGVGVAGVNWQVKIAACKFLGADGSGYTSGAVECLDYFAGLKDRGVNLVATNNSWGGGGYDQALYDAIAAQRDRNILFVAAAGNAAADIDGEASYPASYDLPNILSVAATDENDQLASFSNFGASAVDLGAPGVNVLSTTLGGRYGSYSGTSMATPHVAGVVGLVAAREPFLTWQQRKYRILVGTEPIPALAGKTFTGGRLNAANAVQCGDRRFFVRQEPKQDELSVPTGYAVRIALLSLGCNGAAAPGAVRVQETGELVALRDDGVAPDRAAGDAVYTGVYRASSAAGTYTLALPNGENVVLHVVPAYLPASVAYQWRAIAGTSLRLGDEGYAQLTLPFAIRFSDGRYSTLFVSPNGNVSLSGNGMALAYENQPLPTAAEAIVVAPFWDDLLPGTMVGNVYYAVVGTAPNRELVLEWRDMTPYYCEGPAPPLLRFQVVFSEARSTVLFNYASVEPRSTATCTAPYAGGGSATVGMQHDRTLASQYSFNTRALHDQTTLLWSMAGAANDNPVPRITTLTPASRSANGGAFTLQVDGSGFIGGSQVLWNGTPRTTTWLSETRLTAAIANADIASAGSATVVVRNPQPGGGDSNAAVFTITAAAARVTVVAPNGGDTWRLGSAQSIRWSYSGTAGTTVKIELLKGGALQRLLANSASIGSGGSGQFSWTVPATQPVGTDYRMRVTSSGGFTDTSDADFTISNATSASLTVVAPNGGESWQRRTLHPIRWSYSGSVGAYVRIQLYKNGVLAGTIVPYAAVSLGAFNWTVPATLVPGADYRIKLTAVSNPAISDTSNANFTIF